MSDFSRLVDEVERWPIVIIVAIPESEVIIEDDRIVDSIFLDRGIDTRSYLLIGELWSMYTDDDESLISIFAIPGCDVWESSLTVDTAKRPEVDKYDLATQRLHRERRGVDPLSERCWDLWCSIWSRD